MNKSSYFICLGNGKNQIPLINELRKNNKKIIIIDKKLKIKLRKNEIFIKSSIYDLEKSKLKKNLKNFKIKEILYRSSGPSIFTYQEISKIKKINKININLAKCIYSKTFLSNFLKQNKISNIHSQYFNQKNKSKLSVFKPDAPLVGKKNIFLSKDLSPKELRLIKKSSHNHKISKSGFMEGNDISIIFFKEKLSSKNKIVLMLQEFNEFKSKNLKHLGACSPPIFEFNLELKKKIKDLSEKLENIMKNYYGFYSVSMKIFNNEYFVYEINVGLLGDNFVEIFFPNQFKSVNLIKTEILNDASFIKKDYFKLKKKFIGIIDNKKIKVRKNFINKIKN